MNRQKAGNFNHFKVDVDITPADTGEAAIGM